MRLVDRDNVHELISTFDMQVNDFTAYWERVDGTSVSACIVLSDLSYLQVPLVGVRPQDAESRVVYHATIIVGQWQ